MPARRVDISAGEPFTDLIAVKPVGKNRYGSYLWECLCACGKTVVYTSSQLRTGSRKSCGCRRRLVINVGDRYTRLVVTALVGRDAKRQQIVECLCDCGISVNVTASNLPNTHSCGCLRSELRREVNTVHGLARTPEHDIWCGMKQRCGNPNDSAYEYYGGRGITVFEEWRRDFMAFYNHVGPRPSPEHSIDRYPNNDGNYEPGNVRWATRSEQARNKRTPAQMAESRKQSAPSNVSVTNKTP